MSRSTRVVVVALFLAACDGGGGKKSEDASQTVPICDGSSQVRLAVQIGGGGPASPGKAMLGENGWRFLLVDGGCRALVLHNDNDPLRELTLTNEQEAGLSAALQLSNWQALAGSRPGGCPDAPSISYRFGAERLQGATCGLDPGDPLAGLNTTFDAQLQSLYAAASPVSGDLRYLVLAELGSPSDPRPAVPWPLSIPLESIALPGDNSSFYTRGDSRAATGSEAEQLRAIRTTSENGATGYGGTFGFTRVSAPDGTNYQLYLRDAVPGEQPDGLLPAGTF